MRIVVHSKAAGADACLNPIKTMVFITKFCYIKKNIKFFTDTNSTESVKNMVQAAFQVGSALWSVGRGVFQVANVARQPLKGATTYLAPGLPKVLGNSGRQIAQLLGVENMAPNDAVFAIFRDTLGMAARAGTYAAAQTGLAAVTACLGISASVLGGAGKITRNEALAQTAVALKATGQVIENNRQNWSETAAQSVGGDIITENIASWDPALTSLTAEQMASSQNLGLFDLDDQNADLATQYMQAVDKIDGRDNS
jgi:hypothetical protein